MLQKLNERIQGVIAWVVLSLIAITFTLFGVDYYLQWQQSSDSAITVNGETITKQDFELSYRRQRQQYPPAKLAHGEAQFKKQILESMTVNLVSTQAARHLGFQVSSDQARAAIIAIPQFLKDGHFSRERYQQVLNHAMFTPESFQVEVQQGMLLNQQRFAFIGTSFALRDEIARFVKLYLQKRDYEYIEIPKTWFLLPNQVTEEAIKSWYDAHQKAFLSPEEVSIDYVVLSMGTIIENIHINSDAVKRFYDENQTNFMTPARWKVQRLFFAVPKEADAEEWERVRKKAYAAYQTLQNDKTEFPEWMKSLSTEDKASVTYAPESPWISSDSRFAPVLSKLTNSGEITIPVKTENGYEVFKLIQREPASLKPFNTVKEEILKQLKRDAAEANYAKLLEQLTELAYQTPDSLSSVSEHLKLPIQTSQPLTRKGKKGNPITESPKVIESAFSHDVLTLGNNSEPIQVDPERVVVLRVKRHFPERTRRFAEVHDEVKQVLMFTEAEKAAEAFGKKLIDANGGDIALPGHPLEWQSKKAIPRETDSVPMKINELAFTLPKVGSLQGTKLQNGNYVVVRLTAVHDGQYDALDSEQQKSFAEQLQSLYGLMEYELYINNLMESAKIERE